MDFRENKKERRGASLLLAAVLLILFLGGCARQHWNERLEEEEAAEVAKIVHLMQEESRTCSSSIDATALIFWKSPLEESAIEGYLQLLSPSFFKFVINNPLGQPLYAISSNGETFQSLHIAQQKHIRGNIRALALRNDIPPSLVGGNWFAYLSGRLPELSVEIEEINRDTSSQTIWVHLSNLTSSGEAEKVYLHLAPAKKQVLGYLVLDQEGKTLAEISYQEQKEESDLCTPRKNITVTSLPWGAELRVELKDIRTDTQFQEDDFTLPVPPGYTTQLQP
ncbi:MAG: hypothetical protein KKD01_18845 [Proteobacteria bacterium]|nr:hypothetical protein [Pseudomonadota bacterium]MBU1233624.1 hypothetical protein [Pseudomonadota bacterium]MBU1419812.1 hypothetical protein [Pseudomonadota bacterium]MBU1456780.1 hypothetical protein [Pseudomonadota bacterium]